MSAGAGGPDRPSGADGRPPESAAFEPARVGGPRRAKPPLVASAFMLVLVLVVGAGLSGRLSPGPFPKDVVLASPTDEPVVDPSVFPLAPSDMPAFPADTGPIYTSAPGPMHVEAKRHPQTIFVHGDIDAERITWVYVGVLDDLGRVAGWSSVSVPGAAGPNANGGPAIRFDVELAIPDDFQGRLWVRAIAYDANGKVVATTNVEIPDARR